MRRGAAIACLLLTGACGGEPPLPDVAPPLDLGSMDLAVQRRYRSLAGEVERVRRAPSAAGDQAVAAAYGGLGRFHLAYDSLDAATTCFATAARLDVNAQWAAYLGRARLESGEHELAAEALRAHLRRAPNDRWSGLWLVEARLGSGDVVAAATEALRLLDDDPDDPWALALLARAHLLEDRPREAAELLARASAQAPRSPVLGHLLAEAYRKLGDLDAAARAIADLPRSRSLAAEIRARDPLWQTVEEELAGARVHDRRALSARESGRLEVALVELRQSLRTDPDRRFARLDIADLLVRLGRLEEAETELRALLAEVPDHPPALRFLAAIELRRDDFDAAVALLERTVAADPLDGMALAELGEARRLRGDHAEALEPLRRALALDPGNTSASISAARCSLAVGDRAEAVDELERALLARPGAERATLVLARLLSASDDPGERARALDLAQSVATESPPDLEPFRLETAAMALAAVGRMEAASDHQRRAVEAAVTEASHRRAMRRLERYERGLAAAVPLEPDEPV